MTATPVTLFAEGRWLATAPVRIVGMQLTATMAVLRLGQGDLRLHSPLAMTRVDWTCRPGHA